MAAPPHRAHLTQRHSPTLPHPSTTLRLRNSRLSTRILTAQSTTLPTPFPTSTPPALSSSGHMQIDHATIPALAPPPSLLSVSLSVCNASLLWGYG